MIDFAKLINQTPEEKAAAVVERAEAHAALLAREAAITARLISQVEQLNAPGIVLGAWERQFVQSLASRATDFDLVTSTYGGRLNRLSLKEQPIFDRLVAAHLAPAAAEAPDGEDSAEAEVPKAFGSLHRRMRG